MHHYKLMVIALIANNGILHAQTVSGSANGASAPTAVHLLLDNDSNKAFIQMSGPAGRWMAFGFGGSQMNGTYIIGVDGQNQVFERKLINRTAGSLLTSSFTRTSVHTHNGTTHAYLERPLQGLTAKHFISYLRPET